MTVVPIIELDSGPISGKREGEVAAYLGIPFAAPPLGELRWKPPKTVSRWNDVLECSEYRLACPQPKSKFYDVGETGEDCLYLNVWAPATGIEAGLPVMVWIHGGAFTTGAGSLELYEGVNLAGKGVVVVNMNYRLGPLGFLAHPALSAESPRGVSGNYGLLDQAAALEWVGRNISRFGGDPDRVTLFGESAGAVSICFHLLSPMSADLFHRAIVESGPLWVEKGLPAASRPLRSEEDTGRLLVERLGIREGDSLIESMRAVPAEELVNIASPGEGLDVLKSDLQFGPVVDGWFLPGDPVNMFASCRKQDKPLLVGSNAEEANLFLEGLTIPVDSYEQIVGNVFGEHSAEILEMFPPGGADDATEAMSRLLTVSEFLAPARFTAASWEPLESKSYLYKFSRSFPGNPLGACHGSEIPYVLGNFDPTLGYDDTDFRLSKIIMDYWTAFARTGDPNRDGLSEWPAYSKEKDEYIDLDEDVEVRANPCRKECDLAESIHLNKRQ